MWEDLWGDRRERALERLRSEYLVTEQRFGPVLADELAREAQEIRRRQGTRSGRAEKPA